MYKHYKQVRIQCALFTFLVHATAASSGAAGSTVAVAIDAIVRPPLAFVSKTGTGQPALV